MQRTLFNSIVIKIILIWLTILAIVVESKAYCRFSRPVYYQGSLTIYADGYSYPDFVFSDGCRECPPTFYYGCHRCSWSVWLNTNKNGNAWALGYTFDGLNAEVVSKALGGIYFSYSGTVTYQILGWVVLSNAIGGFVFQPMSPYCCNS